MRKKTQTEKNYRYSQRSFILKYLRNAENKFVTLNNWNRCGIIATKETYLCDFVANKYEEKQEKSHMPKYNVALIQYE